MKIGTSISTTNLNKTGQRIHVRSGAATGDVPTGTESVLDFTYLKTSNNIVFKTSASENFVVKTS
tara:strand:- start:316 stop:510 length:195 start_codon:yes stop_codon:yes gene_type:complete